MKKLTKLTALALALALMLGMTAFADTGILVQYNDFGGANGSFDTFTANSTALGAALLDANAVPSLTAGGTYYWNLNHDIVVEGGKAYLADKTDVARDRVSQIAFALNEPWTYNEDYALVAQIGWDYVSSLDTGATADRTGTPAALPLAGAILTTTDGSADTTKIAGLLSAKKPKSPNGNQLQYAGTYTDSTGSQTRNIWGTPAAMMGEESTLALVIRPYSPWDESYESGFNNPELEGTKQYENVDSLNIVYLPNRATFRNYNAAYYHGVGGPVVKEVSAVYFGATPYATTRFYDFKTYKVSLDRADFVVDDAATQKTGISPVGSFKIVLSHPVSSITKTEGTTDYNLADTITVSKGNTQLTYKTDYDIKLSEIVDTSANTVKGAIEIIPLKDWDYETTYTVGLPTDLYNIARIQMNDYTAEDDATCAVVSFTTGTAPSLTMTLDAYKGLAKGTAADTLEGTVYLEAVAVNTFGKAIDGGILAIAVLDAEGNVVKYATTKKSMDNGARATFGASFKVEAGQTAKAWVLGFNGEAVID